MGGGTQQVEDGRSERTVVEMQAVVTIRMKRQPNHNPQNKKVGVCPFSATCTDVTGEHHSGLFEAATGEQIVSQAYARAALYNAHVTRVEFI